MPKVGKWGEVDGGKSEWEDLPEGAGVRAILMPVQQSKTGESYRLLKVITCPAEGEQLGRFQNDRAVEVAQDVPDVILPEREPPPAPKATQGELF